MQFITGVSLFIDIMFLSNDRKNRITIFDTMTHMRNNKIKLNNIF